MNAVKQTCALALALGALGAGCGSDSSGNNDGDLDASQQLFDASLDAGTDAGFACTSYELAKPPTLCGGSHCQQSPEKLRADTPTTAVCGTNDEVSAFCSLESVDVVGDCAVKAALAMVPDTKQCAAPLLPKVSSACLDCYVASSDCAKNNCFAECLNRKTPACDECRVRAGCIESFYKCAGYVNPLPAALRP